MSAEIDTEFGTEFGTGAGTGVGTGSGTEPAMSLDEPTGSANTPAEDPSPRDQGEAGPASGEVPLRRPRDNRRRRSGQTGAIPTGAIATAVGATGAAGTSAPAALPVPQARTTGTPPTGVTGPIRQLLGPMTGSLRIGRNRAEGGVDQRLRVDWPQCKAHGLCAEIAPEIIHLDEWGYPVFDAGPLASDDVPTARKAVQVCPTLALRLADVPDRR
jgi:ferredoxin